AAGIEAVAICFLHAYANPANEARAAGAARAEAPGLPLSVSSEILPELREFERMNTTVLNAYVQPAVGRYVQRLASRLEDSGVPARLHVMRRSEEHTSELQSRENLVCRLLLEKKKKKTTNKDKQYTTEKQRTTYHLLTAPVMHI